MGHHQYGTQGKRYVERPTIGMGCWVKKRVYLSTLQASYVPCSKDPREGCLTCHWHREHEDEAQRLKLRLENP